MTIEEKIGQLLFLFGVTTKESDLKGIVDKVHPGGMMYRTTGEKDVVSAYKILQENSKIPMLLAANLEAGGNGLITEGTNFGHNMLVAASNDTNQAYRLGLVCAKEAASVGANMAFAPVIDINYNFRNPITNIRSFGDNPDLVATMGAAYVKGAKDGGISVTIKHFPGDGTDGRDQHLVTTHNALKIDDWRKSFGKAYRTSIEAGARGLMVGHIGLPDYFSDDDPDKYMPATLNSKLLNQLLREELGYNGLIMTDSSLMTGFGQCGKRAELVPKTIACGCDMLLFTRMPEDDYNHMMTGYKNGIIADERLDEALTRILAIKASLKLNGKTVNQLVPDNFNEVDIQQHKKWAKELADTAITLVKDEQKLLPLNSNENKKIGVIYNSSDSFKNGIQPYEKLINELKKEGFDAFYYDFGNILATINEMNEKSMDEWKSQFDAIIFLTKWETASNQTTLQLQYKAMGFDAPWFVGEVPTMHISLGSPYHGYDVPMIKTVINAYSPTEAIYETLVEKIVGKSPFKGISPVKLDYKEFQGIV